MGGLTARIYPVRMRTNTNWIMSMLAAILLTGCTHDRYAHSDRAEVIQIAKRVAEREGYHLEDYREPTARYEHDGKWSVFFDGREPMPGNHFSVEVDDRTGDAKTYGGM